MKTILLIAAGLISTGAFAQNVKTEIDGDGNTVVIIINGKENNHNGNQKPGDDKEKDDKDKKDKDKKDKDKDGDDDNNNGKGNSPEDNGPLALADVASGQIVTVYPNPVVQQLHVNNVTGSSATFHLVNAAGAEVSTGVIAPGQQVMDVTPFENGAYIFQLTGNSNRVIYQKRIVISN